MDMWKFGFGYFKWKKKLFPALDKFEVIGPNKRKFNKQI